MGDSHIYKNQRKLRWGYTAGTCVAAASLAAAAALLQGRRMERVSLTMPEGIRLDLGAEEIDPGENSVPYGVRKDVGNDPDVTDGLMVYSQIRLSDAGSGNAGCVGGNYVCGKDKLRLYLSGGVGMGMATQCGLSCEVRKVAINLVPRKMILEQVVDIRREPDFKGMLSTEIRVPEVFGVAYRIFNSRLGVRGGISILGISGVAEPMSETVLLDTIRLELRQRIHKGGKNLLVTPGNYNESFAGNMLGSGLEQAVRCNNFIDSIIDTAVEEGTGSVLLADHGGKLIRLAADTMNTHFSWTNGRMEILAAHRAACDTKRELVEQILEAVTVGEGLCLLETEDDLYEQVVKRVMRRLEQHVKRRAGEGLRVEAIIFTNEYGILSATTGADDLLIYFTDRMRNR